MRGKVCSALTELVDVYPTVADLCGLTAPVNLEGKPFLPLLDDPRRPHKAVARTQLNAGKTAGRAVRTQLSLHHWESDGEKAEELYDHRNDSHEFMNLAGKAEFKQELERHRELLRA